MSMLVVRTGERRKFLVATSLRLFFLSTDVVGSAAVFKVQATYLVVCVVLSCASWKPLSCILGCPSWCFDFRTAFNSFSVTVYVPCSAPCHGFSLRDLQSFSLLFSAELIIVAHYSLRPTGGISHLTKFSIVIEM
jgi:hypothetical protein